MRRWFFGGCVLVILAIASVYFFIPSKLVVSKIVLVKCNADGADRMLGDFDGWARWWPHNGGDRGYADHSYAGVGYTINHRLLHSVALTIDDRSGQIPSLLTIFPLVNIDSCFLQWEFTLQASLNPFKRIGQYQDARRLQEDMGGLLSSFRDYLEKQENVYGLSITEAMTTGSQVEQTSRIMDRYPLTDTIYAEVKKLEHFVAAHGGSITGHPMFNITSLPGGQFQLRVALPTDKDIPATGSFVSKNLPTDKFLQADVHGGDGAVRAAFANMDNYVRDHHRTVVAIPFSSLITDRRTERDTTRWLTRIYYPIVPNSN